MCGDNYHALVLNSSCVISKIKKPPWNRLFFGGSNSLLLLQGFGLVSDGLLCSVAIPCGLGGFSSRDLAANGASVAGAGRLGYVPIALEIESKGRSGRETGNEGVRRWKDGEIGEELSGEDDPLMPVVGASASAPDDFARRVGKLVNTGSRSPLALPSPESDE